MRVAGKSERSLLAERVHHSRISVTRQPDAGIGGPRRSAKSSIFPVCSTVLAPCLAQPFPARLVPDLTRKSRTRAANAAESCGGAKRTLRLSTICSRDHRPSVSVRTTGAPQAMACKVTLCPEG